MREGEGEGAGGHGCWCCCEGGWGCGGHEFREVGCDGALDGGEGAVFVGIVRRELDRPAVGHVDVGVAVCVRW